MVYARAYTLLVALFFGGTTALSFLAVPMLFAYMDAPQLAGALAARYFAVQQWFAVVGCASHGCYWQVPVAPSCVC